MRSKKLTLGFCIFYIAMLTWIIVFKMQFSFATLPDIRNINLIPFGASLIVNGKLQYSEIFQNAAAFVPFGIFMHVLMQGRPFWKQVLPITACAAQSNCSAVFLSGYPRSAKETACSAADQSGTLQSSVFTL